MYETKKGENVHIINVILGAGAVLGRLKAISRLVTVF